MKKRLNTFVTALLLSSITMLLVSGCDFFRILAGRPTSKDIKLKKEAIEKAEADSEQKAQLDSIALVNELKAKTDSIRSSYVAKPVQEPSAPVRAAVRKVKVFSSAASSIERRYCIVIGSFSNPDNAQKLFDQAVSAGYRAIVFRSGSGLTTVGVGPSDSLSEINVTLAGLLKETFCPKDVWVLDNE